jgi:hypothetical protein
MKCILFYCCIAHELKGTGMKTKQIWVDYFVTYILHKSNEVTVSDPADIITLDCLSF